MQFTDFNDVLEFAIEKEEASFRVYSRAATMVTAISARKMFEEMAAQEQGHKQLLQGLDRDRLQGFKPEKVQDLKIGDYLADVEYREDMTYQEILIYSMKAEEKAARLYEAAMALTDNPEAIKMLQFLVEEEKRHKLNIEVIYDDKVLSEN